MRRRVPRRPIVPIVMLATVMLAALAWAARAEPPAYAFEVRITSPLGRTGVPGPVRIVAQVRGSRDNPPAGVRFYVDGVLLGEDREGPPFAVDWVDGNPFEPRAIVAEAYDATGRHARVALDLEPFEIAERSGIMSVLLEVSVQDADGRAVNGLDAARFYLTEDDVPQDLQFVGSETVPATFVLLVDSSQSMYRRFGFVRQAARRLGQYLRPQDRMMVVPFTRELGAITGPSDDLDTVGDAIASLHPSGGTAISDALRQVAELVHGLDGRRAVVLITDGYDEHSSHAMEESLDALKRAFATVYVVGIGGVAGISLRGEQELRRLAVETGGRAFFPWKEIQLPAVHEKVAEDVQHRYLVSYTPSNQTADGAWRRIALRTDDPEHQIRTRDGYFAPAPPPIRPSLELTIATPDHQYLEVSLDDLAVVEDGVPQQVDTFHEATAPMSIVLALDASGSMRPHAEAVREAARTFINALRPQDGLAVVVFDDTMRRSHDLTTSRTVSLDAVDDYEVGGGTALYDAVDDALTMLEPIDTRRIVVALTDGRDENYAGDGPGSNRTLDELLARMRGVDATLFTIGLGPDVDRETLALLARASGGQQFFPEDVSALAEEYRRIIEHLGRRYVIGYTSTNSDRDGAWRSVEITSRLPDALVTSRGGYFAPEAYTGQTR